MTLPPIQAQVGLTGYDTIAYRKFLAENKVEVEGVVRLGEIYQNPTDAATDEAVKFYDRYGIEIPVEAVPKEQLTADRVAVLDDDGTLHVLISPEITGTQEAIEEMRVAVDEVDRFVVPACCFQSVNYSDYGMQVHFAIPLYLILCHRCQLKTNPSDFFMMTLLYSSRKA